jgi:hypothetical protein
MTPESGLWLRDQRKSGDDLRYCDECAKSTEQNAEQLERQPLAAPRLN